MLRIGGEKGLIEVFCISGTVNGSFWSGTYETDPFRRFFVGVWVTVVAGGEKTYRGIGLTVVTHRSSVNERFVISGGLGCQVLPRLQVVQRADQHVELHVEPIVEFGIVEVVIDGGKVQVRSECTNFLLESV